MDHPTLLFVGGGRRKEIGKDERRNIERWVKRKRMSMVVMVEEE